MDNKMNNKGLTIMELLIIVFIIGLLSAIAIPSIIRARENAENSKIKSELRSAYTGISMYYLEKSEYPKTWDDLALYLPISTYKDKYQLNTEL